MALDLYALVRLLFVAASLAMVIAGMANPQFDHDDIYYYFFKIRHGPIWSMSYGGLGCNSLKQTMRAGYAFSVMAAVALGLGALGLGLMLGVKLFAPKGPLARALQLGCVVASGCAFAFLTIGWALSVHGREGQHCASDAVGSLANQGYKIAKGLQLLIAAWCLVVLELIAACLCLAGILSRNIALVTSTDDDPTNTDGTKAKHAASAAAAAEEANGGPSNANVPPREPATSPQPVTPGTATATTAGIARVQPATAAARATAPAASPAAAPRKGSTAPPPESPHLRNPMSISGNDGEDRNLGSHNASPRHGNPDGGRVAAPQQELPQQPRPAGKGDTSLPPPQDVVTSPLISPPAPSSQQSPGAFRSPSADHAGSPAMHHDGRGSYRPAPITTAASHATGGGGTAAADDVFSPRL